MRSMTSIVAALLGLLAVAGFAAAQDTAECPECDPDVPAMDDCTYSSVDTGLVSNTTVDLVDTDACISKPGDERGFWAVFSLCLTQILDICGEMFGLFASFDLFVSEDGIDLDGGIATTDGDIIDIDETPVGQLDDETWGVMPQTELPVETPETPEVPLELPESLVVNECIYGTDVAECQ